MGMSLYTLCVPSGFDGRVESELSVGWDFSHHALGHCLIRAGLRQREKARAGVWHGLGFSWDTQVAAPWPGVDWSQEGLEPELSVNHSFSQGILAIAALAKDRMKLQELEKQPGTSHGFFWGVMMVAFFMGHGA